MDSEYIATQNILLIGIRDLIESIEINNSPDFQSGDMRQIHTFENLVIPMNKSAKIQMIINVKYAMSHKIFPSWFLVTFFDIHEIYFFFYFSFPDSCCCS